MKHRTAITLLSLLLLMACQYSVPLSIDHSIAIDPSLLGNWKMLAEEDDPGASLDSITVLPFSNTEYLLHYVGEGSGMFFRAYLIEPGGDRLLQLELLGSDEGPLTENDDAHRYIVARYSLEGTTLTVSTMNTELVSRDINSTGALLKAYLENRVNPGLFANPARFGKT